MKGKNNNNNNKNWAAQSWYYRASLKLGSTEAYPDSFQISIRPDMCCLWQTHISGSAAFELALCYLLTPNSLSVFYKVYSVVTRLMFREGETGEHRKIDIYNSFHTGITYQ